MSWFFLIPAALGSPLTEPDEILAGRALRAAGAPVVLGASLRDPYSLVFLAQDAGIKLRGPALAPERAADPESWGLGGILRPEGGIAVGTHAPILASGEDEPGLLSARVRGEGAVWWGPLEARLAPQLDLELAPGSASLELPEAWAGLHTARWVVGFGLRDRWIGPGRMGALLLTDNARPAPLGSVAWTSAPRPWGQGHVEAGAGWLDGARADVQRPGWRLVDTRLALFGYAELGATRMALFGGVGRPPVDLWQLLLPTEPHVYDDPDQTLPDQNELASLDLRVTLPVGRWGMGPVQTVEGWWQYGGEDMIVRHLGALPYPSLAGVGNLFGVEILADPWSASVEGARLLDDYFRWYTGHRVYHDGFTREGHSMGMPWGGDSRSAMGSLTWLPQPWGAQLSVWQVRRVGVMEASGDNLLALATDETRLGAGVTVWRQQGSGWWRARLDLERMRGEDFVPGADGLSWRISLQR